MLRWGDPDHNSSDHGLSIDDVTATFTTTAPTTPTLTISPATLSGFSTTTGTPSAAQTYTLSGSNLTADVTVTAPTGYEVAQSTGTTPGAYAATQTVAQADATAGSTISVRLTGAAAGSPSGNVTNTSPGTTTRNVAVSGTVVAPTSPTLTTNVASAVTTTGATLNGTISSFGAPTGPAPAYGFVYSLTSANATPTLGGAGSTTVTVGTAAFTGAYSSGLTNLPTGTGYSYQAYATNGNGTSYGGVQTFTTAAAMTMPTVTTTAATAVTATTATSGGNVTANGGAVVTARGVVYGTTANPRIGGPGVTQVADANGGTGSFTSSLTGLAPGTTYYVAAYATNSVGTSYGADQSFMTPVQQPSPAGQLALEENFDYPAGTVLVASGTAGTADPTTGWYQNGSANNNAITTAADNLSRSSHQYPQGVLAAAPAGTSSDVSLTTGQDVFKPFTQPTGATAVYAAALVSVTSTTTTGDYFLHFITSSSAFVGRVYARTSTNNSANFNFSVSIGNETPTYNTTTDFVPGTIYLVVVKYENSAATNNVDVASLYVLDPTAVPITEPTPTATTTGTTSNRPNITNIALRQGNANAPTVTLDALRIASGWGAAVGRVVYTTAGNTVVSGDYYSLRVTGTGTVATVAPTGPGNGVTPATAVVLEKQLNLNGGQVAVPAATTAAPNPLLLRYRNIIGDGFEILADGGTSYVDGPVSREATGGPSLLFPVGRNGNYRPLTLNITNAAAGTTIYTTVQTDASAYTADPVVNAPLTRVSRVRYFTITPNPVPAAGAFQGSVELTFGPDDQVTDPSAATFVVAKSDGAGWNSIDRSSNTGTTNNGAFVNGTLKSGMFQNFSNFTLASTAADPAVNPLPVQLTSFAAVRAARGGVALAWATASELRSARFEVERSLDGKTFERVAAVAAQGTSAQAHEYATHDAAAPAGQLYYRLRLVDLDGTAAYSPVATVAAGPAGELALAPNPAHDQLGLFTEAATAYLVRNTLGQTVLAGTTLAGSPTTLDVNGLTPGIYFLELPGSAGRTVRKFVKE